MKMTAKRPEAIDINNRHDIIFGDPESGMKVLGDIRELINTFGYITIADYYMACGIQRFNSHDDSYGWSDLSYAAVIECDDGYVIAMPEARLIED